MNKKNVMLGIVFAIAVVFLLPVSIFAKLFLVSVAILFWLLDRLLSQFEKLWLSLIASLAFSSGMTMLAIRFLSTGSLAVAEWWLYLTTAFFIITIRAIRELVHRNNIIHTEKYHNL